MNEELRCVSLGALSLLCLCNDPASATEIAVVFGSGAVA